MSFNIQIGELYISFIKNAETKAGKTKEMQAKIDRKINRCYSVCSFAAKEL